MIRLQSDLNSLEISHEQLVDMAVIIGTDFNDGIRGYGPKKSLSLIKKFGSIEKALSTIESADKPTLEEIKQIREIFLNPATTDDYLLDWSTPDKEAVLKILCDQHQFSQERIEPIIEKFSIIKNIKKQRNLMDF